MRKHLSFVFVCGLLAASCNKKVTYEPEPAPRACSIASDCHEDEFCVGGVCVDECSTPECLEQMGLEKVRRSPTCSNCPVCREDRDCGAGRFCQVGMPPRQNRCVVNPCGVPDPSPLSGEFGGCTVRLCADRTVGYVTVTRADGTVCDDGNACTSASVCMAGACAATIAVSCDDSNLCTTDSCDAATGCVHSNNTLACDDGNACTTDDRCGDGACSGGLPLDCDDQNVCTDDACAPASGCVNTNNTMACDDDDACTQQDVCSAGECVGDNPIVCEAMDTCHRAGSCDPLTGVCNNPVQPNDTACDDEDACTQEDRCSAGVCLGSTSLVCDRPFEQQCVPETGSCDPASCDPANDTTEEESDCAQFREELDAWLTANGLNPALYGLGCQEAGQTPPMPRPNTCAAFERDPDDQFAVSNFEEQCGDGLDGDVDGLVDCDDADCQGTMNCNNCSGDSQCPPGSTCQSASCVPAEETSCTDQVDNNNDDMVDCDDTDCASAPECAPPPPPVCSPACAAGEACVDGVCVAPSPEVCDNGFDDDGDTFSDCRDSDCAFDAACPQCDANRPCPQGQFCTAQGTCQANPPANQLRVVWASRGTIPSQVDRLCLLLSCNGVNIPWAIFANQPDQCGARTAASLSLTFDNANGMGTCKANVVGTGPGGFEWWTPGRNSPVSGLESVGYLTWGRGTVGATCADPLTCEGVRARDNGEGGGYWLFSDPDPFGTDPATSF